MTMSWMARAQRRGAISQAEFLAEMDRWGFVEDPKPRLGATHEFTHPDTGERAYTTSGHEGYAAALLRLRGELEVAREDVGLVN